jgi:hypothetical protein
MKSWKIGAIAGLIAGIIAGLVAVFITAPLIFRLGLPYLWIPLSPETTFTKIAIIEFTIVLIWGIILGIIYSRIQELIPGNRILKGLLFGLAYYWIFSIRIAMISFAYGQPVFMDARSLLFLHPIIYGLVLGILYKAPKEKSKIKKHEIMSGIIPGAITGFIFAVGIIIYFILLAYFGGVLGFSELIPDYLTDIEFIIYQFMSHGWMNMLWFAVYGAFYAEFYDKIPGKAIIKGGIFGFIIWLITNAPIGLYCYAHGDIGNANGFGLFLPEGYLYIGIVLEGIYKRRYRAFIIAAIVYAIVTIRLIISSLLGWIPS